MLRIQTTDAAVPPLNDIRQHLVKRDYLSRFLTPAVRVVEKSRLSHAQRFGRPFKPPHKHTEQRSGDEMHECIRIRMFIWERRFHVLAGIVAIVTVLVLFASLRVRRSLAGNLGGNIAFWVFVIVALLIPVVGIGMYEGGYNHGLKDVLYFSGASAALMDRLFPAPTYEMPNDGFFETTGVLQFPLALFTGWELVKAIRLARKP